MDKPVMDKKGRLVGIDYGKKRIGLSISDDSQLIARILTTLPVEKRQEQTIDRILLTLSDYEVAAIVVGYPLRLNGQCSVMSDEVKDFFLALQRRSSCEVLLWDERLTTLQAERSLKEAHLSRKRRSKIVDGVAAVILLQCYLDMRACQSTRYC